MYYLAISMYYLAISYILGIGNIGVMFFYILGFTSPKENITIPTVCGFEIKY